MDNEIYAIRTDANEKIATGHVMRCLAIAQELSLLAKTVIFLTSDERSNRLIHKYGFQTITLNSDYLNLEQEIPNLILTIKDLKIQCLLVDSFHVTPYYFQRINQYVKIAYLDYLHDAVYNVHGLINYDITYEQFDYKSKYPNTKLFLGSSYVPLRKEFSKISPKEINPDVKHIMITTGGTDMHSMSIRIAKVLAENPEFMHIKIHIVIGAFFECKRQLIDLANLYNNVYYHENVKISELMKSSDIAISAGGSTCYEFCACGVPTVVFSTIENQIKFCKKLDHDKIMMYAGHFSENKIISKVAEKVAYLLKNKAYREQMSKSSQNLVDGKGATRIADALVCL